MEPEKGVGTQPRLQRGVKGYLLSETKAGYRNPSQSKKRAINRAFRCIQDLILIAEKLPEDEQAKIFNETYMRPLFHALFNMPSIDVNDSEEKSLALEKRRQRVIGLWNAFFSGGIISDPFYGAKLVNRDVSRALSLDMDKNLQAILYAIRFQEPEEQTKSAKKK